jgi:hypothetical protein
MCTLSICICNRIWCVHWAYATGADAHFEHVQQLLTQKLSACISFPIFQMFIWTDAYDEHVYKELFLRFLRIHIRNLCEQWAYTTGTHACTEHTHQELMCALSIHIRNLWEQWTYASGTYACIDNMWKKLMRLLSIRIGNWCMHWILSVKIMKMAIKFSHSDPFKGTVTWDGFLS